MTELQDEILKVMGLFNYPSQNVLALAELVNQRRLFQGKQVLISHFIIQAIDGLAGEPGLPENLKSVLKRIYNYGR
ncbi:hypothetical protein A2Y83_04090 [Candidatus Falkowbacteria bacterium RBG_13_39_14]|uniref:Uncharacterized protein n=1 Tax=Candidatus Falkowbacteria bacterium RBG_13_39_14 TaxID=1797985 RepID=A0A1F5S7G8_9BACT|nr:MAG: hypothetical protein A2Y83_04090 [Candidatus Falkowbacteria bacterium RBG_13_39_14]